MPTYEYACRECGQHLEVVQSFKDSPLTTCGACGGVLRKVFSAAGIIFKGSGYYVTDTRKKAAGESSTAASGRAKSDKSDKSDKSGTKAAGGSTSESGSGSDSGGAAESA